MTLPGFVNPHSLPARAMGRGAGLRPAREGLVRQRQAGPAAPFLLANGQQRVVHALRRARRQRPLNPLTARQHQQSGHEKSSHGCTPLPWAPAGAR